jgi:hypothetical protein
MTLPLIKRLKAGAPAPRVVLLPDALFFTRPVPVAAGATPPEVAAQAELALEALSPFPPAQLYHGCFWTRGETQALVFAAYRRRFTDEQTAEWANAELVLPAFATLLGGGREPGTTILVPSAEGLTALHWETGAAPARVVFHPLPPEASEDERAAVRTAATRAFPGSLKVIELDAAPVAVAAPTEGEFVFRAGDFSTDLSAAQAAALDVRDKAELAVLRRLRVRDTVLWRTFLGSAAALLLLAAGELALFGAGFWQKSRLAKADAQRPVVEKIETAQTLATHIDELSTKRLLPFEMISLVSSAKPAEVRFLRTATDGLYTLIIDAESTSPAAVSAYQAALTAQTAYEHVEVRDQRTRDNVMNFTVAVTFKPVALKPAAPAS